MRSTLVHTMSLLVLFLSQTVPACAQDVPVDEARTVDVMEGKTSRSPSYYAKHKGHEYERQTTILQSGNTKYGVHYRACIDESHGEKVGIVEGYIGLNMPTNENFYGGGFLRILLNDQDVGEWRLADRRIIEEGERGGCQYVWEAPVATVRARFLLLPGTGYLCCEISWEPKEPIATAEVRLLCYPSFFTTARGRKGERHVISAAKDVTEGKPFAIEPEKESWLYYCDRIFDVARGEGAGPCAALFMPDEIEGGSISIGGYGVSTSLKVKSESRRVRLVFWEFPGRENAEALVQLKGDAAHLLHALPSLDFTPEVLQTSSVSKLRAEFAQLLETAGDAAAPCREEIETLLAKLPKGDGGQSSLANWKAEANVLAAVPKLQKLRGELRIRALLARGDRMP